MHAYTRGKTLRLTLPMQGRLHFPRPCSELDKLPERRLEPRLPRTSLNLHVPSHIDVGTSPLHKRPAL
jgi:hypothetical protein